MSFLTPLALLGVLILGPIIVAMYLLKLRREERTVASTFLWRQMMRDVEANAPWQKLRRNLLLLLQLLLLALLLLALARPFFLTTGISGRNLIIVLDRSASMGATDVAPSRLDAARAQAIALVDQLPDGGRATLIAAGGQLEVPVATSTDRRQIREAINAVRLSADGTSDLAQPLALAAALASREAGSEVAIISDGNVSIPPDLTMPTTVRYFAIGQGDGNTAISAMTLDRGIADQQLFIQVSNYGTQPVTRRIDLYLDGTLANAFERTIEPGGFQNITLDVPAVVREAEARIADDPTDLLPLDNRAWAVSNAGDAATIRVIGPGNRFLETVLSLFPGVNLLSVPAATTTFTETIAEVPVTIFDGVVPATLPPGNLLFIAPPVSTEFFSVTGQIDFPALRPIPGETQLLRNVTLSDVSVLKAVRLSPGGWARTVVDGDGGPLLLAGEQGGRRIAVLAFRLQDSDLPLQVAFPLLMSNLLGYLAPGIGVDASQVAPGQSLVVPVDPSTAEVRVIRPDGRTDTAQIQAGQAIYADTNLAGPYIVEQRQGERILARQRFAVNMFAPEESRIAPQPDLAVAQVSGLQQAVTREQVGRQEFWRWLAALALLVLLIEWVVYQRSSIAALRERFDLWRRSRRTSGTLQRPR